MASARSSHKKEFPLPTCSGPSLPSIMRTILPAATTSFDRDRRNMEKSSLNWTCLDRHTNLEESANKKNEENTQYIYTYMFTFEGTILTKIGIEI